MAVGNETYVKFIYPPNFEGTYTQEDFNRKDFPRRYIIKCTCIIGSAADEEDLAIKAKRQDLWVKEGIEPGRLALEKIEYDIYGLQVKVEYDNENDEFMAILPPGQGVKEFPGGYIPEPYDSSSEFDGGNICFTTIGATENDTYDITLTVRPKE